MEDSKDMQEINKNLEDTITIDILAILTPISIIIASFILSIGMYLAAGRIGSGQFVNIDEKIPSATPAAAGQPQEVSVSIDDDAIKGDIKKAKVVIVEFSDYECPFCARFYNDTLGQIQTNYIDNGEVAFIYRDLPLSFHPFAQKQAEAAECAGEEGDDKYYAMHNKIFEGGGQFGADQLKGLAEELGLNTSKFNSCLDNGDMADEVSKDIQAASAVGISGTPGFVVGNLNDDGMVDGEVLSGAQPYAAFEQVIKKYL